MRISPSVLEKLEACPSYTKSEFTQNEAAAEGTLMHKAVETNDTSILEREEQVEQVNRCIAVCDQIIMKMNPDEGKVLREFQIAVNEIKGTLDFAVLLNAKQGALVDYKFGRQPVTSAENNIQLQAYVLGLFLAFPELEEVEATLIQPRLDVLSSHVYKRENAGSIYRRIENIVLRASLDAKEEVPSDKACLYCSRKAECKALSEVAHTAGNNIGMNLPLVYNPNLLARPADRAKAQILSYILEDWAKQVRDANAKAVLERGETIPGFELRSRAGNTTVNETVNAVTKVAETYGLSFETILQACSLSATQLTDVIHALKGGKKKEIRDGIDTLLAPFSTESKTVTFLQKKRGMSYEAILEECK